VIAGLRRFVLRLANFIRPAPADRQLEREVASHLVLMEEDLQRRGMTPEEAAVAARRTLRVHEVRERHRDARSFVWLEDARRDLRYAVRTLSATPGFTLLAVLTLALGIGSVTVIYSVIHDVLLDPLPYPDSGRFVNVRVRDTASGGGRAVLPAAEFLDFQQQSDVFEDVIGTRGDSLLLKTPDRVEILRAVHVTPNFFEVMGLPPLLGRAIGPADAAHDAPLVAVLRHRAWVSYFGADPGVVGRAYRFGEELRTVVGVMPPRFTWHAADVWIPRPVDLAAPDAVTFPRNFQARLKPGATIEQAEAQLNVIAARRARSHPDEYPETFRIEVVNVIEDVVGDFRGVLYTALAAVGLLLLIACCNVANMLLARATAREREMTIRAALGAGRGRIVRQLIVEGLLLALAGAAAGALLAHVGVDLLVRFLPEGPLPGEVAFGLGGPALVVSLVVAVSSAVLFGIAPALYAARRDLVQGLRGEGRGVAGGRGRLRNALVVTEVALSLVLLLGAGLLMRTFVSLVRVETGVDADRILVVFVVFPPGEYEEPAARRQFFDRALERISALPLVEAASATQGIPVFGGFRTELGLAGDPPSRERMSVVQWCTEDYFRTVGLTTVAGVHLPRIGPDEAPRTTVVNQTFASTYFGGAAGALGQSIELLLPVGTSSERKEVRFEIVGVVRDVRNQGIREGPAPHVYLPDGMTVGAGRTILVRAAGDPRMLAEPTRRVLAEIDSNVAIRPPDTFQEALDRYIFAQPRFSLLVLAVFAITGTVLVAIGVFSVMAYTVSRQTREIAVRIALGASRRQAMGVVLGLAIRLLAVGIAAGWLASLATTRLIEAQLWNTSRHDPLTAVAAIGIVAAVALVACYLPARRAMGVDPVVALRHE